MINQVDSTAISNSNEYNIVNALAAKAPNVKITNQAGDPGASSYIQIRGLRSLSGSGQPLFVVDGTPIDNSTISTTAMTGGTVAPNRAADIDPNDIESVDILKGSAAAAIYGAAASDGAILITTKTGKSGATRFSFNTQLQLNDVSHDVPLQTDWAQGNGGVTDPCSVNLTTGCTATSISYGAQLAAGTPTYDHYTDLFREGDQWNNNLTLSGGNDKTTYFLSMGYSNTQGVITGPNNWYDQYNLRVKASQRLADRVVVSGNIAYVDTHGSFIQRGSNVSGLLLGGLRTPPAFNNQPFLDTLTGLQRSYRHPAYWPGSQVSSRGYDNPFFVLNEDPATSQLNRAFGNVAIDWEVNDWLSLKDNLGGDYYNDQRTEALAQSSSGFPTGSVTIGNNSIYSIDNYLTATGTHTFSPNFSGSLTLGTDAQSQSVTQNFTTGQTLVAPTPFALTNTVVYVPATFNSLIHSLSYYAHATADLYNQLYVTLGMRRDGFSTFGESEPYAWYPQANVAWTFTNALGNTEQKGVLSFGKLRVGYGETGKPPAPYSTQTVLAAGASSFFGSGYGDLLLGTQNGKGGLLTGGNLGNNNILPEREKELEAGVDFGFFNQTVNAGITWYKENSTDVIQALPIPPSTGFFGALSNAAAIENKGFEVTANWRPLTTAKTSLEFGVTWGQNFTSRHEPGRRAVLLYRRRHVHRRGGRDVSEQRPRDAGTGLHPLRPRSGGCGHHRGREQHRGGLQWRAEERVVHRFERLPGHGSEPADHRESESELDRWVPRLHALRQADRHLPGGPQAGRPGVERNAGRAGVLRHAQDHGHSQHEPGLRFGWLVPGCRCWSGRGHGGADRSGLVRRRRFRLQRSVGSERGRRHVHEAPRDRGAVHVLRSLGHAQSRSVERGPSRRWSQPVHLDELHGR